MKRVWKCPKCQRTFDLAREIPKLQAGKGRLLTDEEMGEVLTGAFHVCPGEGAGVDFEDAPEQQQFAAMDYDWETGKAR